MVFKNIVNRWGGKKIFLCCSAVMRRANTFNKMKTVGFVLKELNCDKVYLFDVRGGIPTIIYLIFDPGEEIRKILEIKDLKSKEYLENLLNRHPFEKIKL